MRGTGKLCPYSTTQLSPREDCEGQTEDSAEEHAVGTTKCAPFTCLVLIMAHEPTFYSDTG